MCDRERAERESLVQMFACVAVGIHPNLIEEEGVVGITNMIVVSEIIFWHLK